MEVLPRLAILVVDDEPNIRKTLTISLEAEGHPGGGGEQRPGRLERSEPPFL